MTEYDYSPEAERDFHRRLDGVAHWTKQTAKFKLCDPALPPTPATTTNDIDSDRERDYRRRHRRDRHYRTTHRLPSQSATTLRPSPLDSNSDSDKTLIPSPFQQQSFYQPYSAPPYKYDPAFQPHQQPSIPPYNQPYYRTGYTGYPTLIYPMPPPPPPPPVYPVLPPPRLHRPHHSYDLGSSNHDRDRDRTYRSSRSGPASANIASATKPAPYPSAPQYYYPQQTGNSPIRSPSLFKRFFSVFKGTSNAGGSYGSSQPNKLQRFPPHSQYPQQQHRIPQRKRSISF